MGLKKIMDAAFWVAVGGLILWIGGLDASLAGTSGADRGDGVAAAKQPDIRQAIQKTDAAIGRLRAMTPAQAAAAYGVTAADIEKRLVNLGALDAAYKRLRMSVANLETLEGEKAAIAKRYEKYPAGAMADDPPFTLTFLDSVHEKLSNAERDIGNIDLTIEMLHQEVSEHQERLAIVEEELRKGEETLKRTTETERKAIRWMVDDATLQHELLRTIIEAISNEIQRHELEKGLMGLQVAYFREQTAFVKSNVAYSDADLKHQLDAIGQEKADIQKENQRLRKEQKGVEQKWLMAQQNFERAMEGPQRSAAEAYLNARAEWRKTYQIAIELNEKASLLLDRQMRAWQKRYGLVQGKTSLDRLREMRGTVQRDLDGLGRTLQLQQRYLIDLQKQIASIEGRLGEEGVFEPVRRHLTEQLNALRRQLDRRLAYQSLILSVDQVEKRLFGEIENAMGQLSIKDHLADIKEDIVDFWNIEIWVVDNHPVTVRKVAIALVILVAGLVLSNFFLSMIRSRFLLKSQFKETTASAVHKILSYSTYLLVVLFALRMVNIPLTAFAFLGGAVAIGVGFGAQNLINNFISGFMILGERPINIGDLIEIEGVLGKVEEIGARCTRVRTGENIHILVPNSGFLEKNIINWTLSDQKIRTHVTVGVSYGSPVKRVEETLLQAVGQVARVMREPKPFVLFSDFGDNALIFNVYFWVSIRRVIERRQIESDVRFKIDDLFSQEGIVIAFPQRDVHLDTLRPLEISLADKP